jgi:polysaccharide pyruvyl transferase WcaK-like protein
MPGMDTKMITILYGLPDTNAGGSALGISLIKVLKSHFPGYKINYVSSHCREDIIQKAYPFLKTKYPEVEILPYPIPARSDSYDISNNFFRMIKKIMWAVTTLSSVLFIIFPILKNDTLKKIKNSTLLVGRGTQIFYDRDEGNPIQGIIAKYWLCFPLFMAWRYKTPYVIYAQSIGPIHNPINKWLIKFVFKRAALILPREEFSRDYLIGKIKIQPDRVKLVPDSVFALDPPGTETIKKSCAGYGLTFKRYLVLVIRQLMNKDADITHHFPLLEEVIRHTLANHFVEKCIVVTQCHYFPDYKAFESDSKISRKLFDYLQENLDDPGKVDLIDQSLSPDELLRLYGGARYVISLRLHAVIFSLIAGTPAVAISYWGLKSQGIMKMLNMEKLVIDSNCLDKDVIIDRVEEIEKNYPSEIQKIIAKIERIREEANNSPLLLKELLMNYQAK